VGHDKKPVMRSQALKAANRYDTYEVKVILIGVLIN